MALEEPKVGANVQFRPQFAFSVGAALFADMRDAVQHQHVRARQLGVAFAEHLTARATQELLVGEILR